MHLVLARLPDAPPGIRGISLFLVPKFVVTEDGTLGARNGVACGAIEHKMGIKASSTCVMNFDAAGGSLIGAPHKGMRCMFTMMNTARLAVGIQGLGIGTAFPATSTGCVNRKRHTSSCRYAPVTLSFLARPPGLNFNDDLFLILR